MIATTTGQPRRRPPLTEKPQPRAYTIKQTQSLTNLGETTIKQLIRERILRTIKVGRRRLVLAPSIEELLAGED
jgi:excisionase family DNA binding protein